MVDPLRDRARNRYERARFLAALPWALPAVVLMGISGPEPAALVAGLLLGVVLVFLHWHGRGPARGARVGLRAGAVAFVLPYSWELWNGGCCAGPSCAVMCVTTCIAGGLGAAAVAAPALHRSGSDPGHAMGLLAVASLTAAVGCLPVGLAGGLGIAALWAASAPVLLAARS